MGKYGQNILYTHKNVKMKHPYVRLIYANKTLKCAVKKEAKLNKFSQI